MKLIKQTFNLYVYETEINKPIDVNEAINTIKPKLIKLFSGKWYLVVDCEFERDNILARVGFRNRARIDTNIDLAMKEIDNNFNNFSSNGSGWIFKHINYIRLYKSINILVYFIFLNHVSIFK